MNFFNQNVNDTNDGLLVVQQMWLLYWTTLTSFNFSIITFPTLEVFCYQVQGRKSSLSVGSVRKGKHLLPVTVTVPSYELE
jgi:hypothetical protein